MVWLHEVTCSIRAVVITGGQKTSRSQDLRYIYTRIMLKTCLDRSSAIGDAVVLLRTSEIVLLTAHRITAMLMFDVSSGVEARCDNR